MDAEHASAGANEPPKGLSLSYYLINDVPVAVARRQDEKPYHAVRYDPESQALKGDAMIFMALLNSEDVTAIDRSAFKDALSGLGCSDDGPAWLNQD